LRSAQTLSEHVELALSSSNAFVRTDGDFLSLPIFIHKAPIEALSCANFLSSTDSLFVIGAGFRNQYLVSDYIKLTAGLSYHVTRNRTTHHQQLVCPSFP
jgi:hypothetical protein